MREIFSPRLFGLALWQAWWLILGNTDLAVSKTGGETLWGIGINVFTLLYTCMTLGYVATLVWSAVAKRPMLSGRSSRLAVGGAAALGTVFLIAFGSMASTPEATMARICACAMVGCGNAALMCMWAELWGSLQTSRVGLNAFASYLLGFVVMFAVGLLPAWAGRVVCCLLPLASALSLELALKEPRREPTLQEHSLGSGLLTRVFIFLFAVSAAHGFTQASPLLADPGFVGAHMVIDFLVLGVVFLFITFTMPLHEAPVLFKFVLFALCAGLVALTTESAPLRIMGNGTFLAGIHGLEIVVFVVVSDIAFKTRRSVAFSLSLCFLLLRAGSVVAHVAVWQLRASGLYSDDAFSWAARVVLLTLLFLGFVVLSDSAFQEIFNLRPTVREKTPDIATGCSALAKKYGLTARELEVLELVAQGRTNPYIAKELVISANTARNHVSNIYRKVGVYDRQQLLDVVNGGR